MHWRGRFGQLDSRMIRTGTGEWSSTNRATRPTLLGPGSVGPVRGRAPRMSASAFSRWAAAMISCSGRPRATRWAISGGRAEPPRIVPARQPREQPLLRRRRLPGDARSRLSSAAARASPNRRMVGRELPGPGFSDVEERDLNRRSAGAHDLGHLLRQGRVLGAGKGDEKPPLPAHGRLTSARPAAARRRAPRGSSRE